MRIVLSDFQIDRVIANRRKAVGVGASIMALAFVLPRGWGFVLTGFVVLSRGVCALNLRRWRTEPGLWMLGLLLTIGLGGGWGYFEALRLQGLFMGAGANPARPGRKWEEIGFATDAAIAMTLFGHVTWFLVSATLANWRQTSVRARRASLDEPRAGIMPES